MKLTPFSDENVLGVDIGTHSIKIVETRFTAGKPVPLRAVSAEIDFSKASDPKGKWEAYVVALKKLLIQHKIGTKLAVIGIPNTALVVDINRSSESAGAPGGMRLEGKEEETYIQPLFGPGQNGALEKRVLTVTADRGAVVDRFEIARDAGLVPMVADVNIFAALNAYLPTAGLAEKGLVFLINIGANTTELAVMSNGLVMAVRTVFLAGNNLSVTLQRELDVPLSAAEAFKKKHGLLARSNKDDAGAPSDTQGGKPGNALAIKASDLLSERVDQIIAEIKRTIAYYADKTPGPDMRAVKLVLTGGSAELPGLDKYLGAAFGVPVETFLPRFSVAAGLSMRRWPRERTKLFTAINLLPKALLRRANYAGRLIGYALLVTLFAGGYYKYDTFIHKVEGDVMAHKAKLSVLRVDLDRTRKAVEAANAEKKPEPPAVPAKPAPPKDPYAYIRGLKVSGVFTDPSGASAILVGPGESFIVKNGKMFYESGKAVAGVSTTISPKNVIVTAGGNKYEINIPQ